MKINRKLKHLFIVITGISSIAVASLAFADNGNSDNFIQPLTKSIDKLSKELQALAIANVKSNNDMRYQVDQYFPNTIPKDNDGNNLSQSTQLAGSALTQQQVNQLLQTFPVSLNPTIQITDPSVTIDTNDQKDSDSDSDSDKTPQQQLTDDLTLGSPANDTLYLVNNYGCSNDSCSDKAVKPTEFNNGFFNFDTLLAPESYSTKQQLAAQRYIQYALKTYIPVDTGFDFDKLNAVLSNMKKNDRAQWLQSHVVNTDAYKNYQLMIRSLVASKSLLISNLNYLYAQRTPQKDLGKKAGLDTNDASPLQVENASIDNLVDNPDWYKSMKTASPATIQRQQLLLLAYIAKQLHQQQQTSQRVLATLSILASQAGLSDASSLKQAASQVNSLFENQEVSQ